MDLVRDLLDKQIVDRHGHKSGKVDGIVLQLRPHRPPRVVWLEVGTLTLARRLHRRLGHWVLRLGRRWRRSARPYRIAWTRVRKVGIDVVVDLDAERTRLYAAEHWLRTHVIDRIPGG